MMSVWILGCTSTETRFTTIECSPVGRPMLEHISVEELTTVSDDTYRKLRLNQERLIRWGEVNSELIEVLCEGP